MLAAVNEDFELIIQLSGGVDDVVVVVGSTKDGILVARKEVSRKVGDIARRIQKVS